MSLDKATVELDGKQVEFSTETIDGLRFLAESIRKLDITEKTQVHAEMMDLCKGDEYPLAFYEAAIQIIHLLQAEFDLVGAVMNVADVVPQVVDIPFSLQWGPVFSVTKQQLLAYANKIKDRKNLKGPDANLTRRILSKKATADEWKLYALRYADVDARMRSDQANFWEFFMNEPRAGMEIAELKKNIRKVMVNGDVYEMARPHHPPWFDFGLWDDADKFGRGFGDLFRPALGVSMGDDDSSWATEVDEDGDQICDNNLPKSDQITGVMDKANIPAARTEHVVASLQNDSRTEHVVASLQNDSPLPQSEWPSLPIKHSKDSPSVLPSGRPANMVQQGNAWNNGQRKKFMNNGIAKGRRKLNYSPPVSTETDFLIDVERAYSIKDVWGFSLLGQYVGRHPGHKAIKTMMDQWGVKTKYKIEEGWMIFSFESEDDQEKVLIDGPYMINGRPMILKHVPDKFAFTNEDFATIPLWMRIYGLGSRFWTEEFLGGIASYVGKPLYLDPVTDSRKRNSYARVLVEINLAEKVVRKIPLKFSDGDSFTCRVQLENEPKFCKECCVFGHNKDDCLFLHQSATAAYVKQVPQVSELPKSAPVQSHKQPAAMGHYEADNNLIFAAAATGFPSSTSGHTRVMVHATGSAGVSSDGQNVAPDVTAVKNVGLQNQQTVVNEGNGDDIGDKEDTHNKANAQNVHRGSVPSAATPVCINKFSALDTDDDPTVLSVDRNDNGPLTGKGQQHESLAAANGENSKSHAAPNLPQSTVFGTRASGRKKGSKV